MTFTYWVVNRNAPLDVYQRQVNRAEAARILRACERPTRKIPGWVREYELVTGVTFQITGSV